MSGFSSEFHAVVYNDVSGEKIVVRPDRDALDLVEIIHEETAQSFVMTVDEAILVAKGMIEVAERIKKDVAERKV